MQNQRPAVAMALVASHDHKLEEREGDQLLPVKITSGNLDWASLMGRFLPSSCQ